MAIRLIVIITAVFCLVTAVWLRGLWSPTPPEVVSSRYTGKESPENNPGLHTAVDSATSRYIMQQIMLRVKDPKASLDFYTRVMGMSLIKRFDNPEQKSTLYFLGYEDLSTVPSDPIDRSVWTVERKATLELAHSWGTESNPEFKGYHDGNSHPLGFGHIGITVDDVYKACERFESLGVNFIKKPTEGAIKGVAFIRDPDGYKIEIFDPIRTAKIVADLGSA